MSTRSYIGKLQKGGRIKAIYCHFDGYIAGVGATLFEHYQDVKKIDELLEGGAISVLDGRIDAPEGHSFLTPVEGYTVFYHRDRGEPLKHTAARLYWSKLDFILRARGVDYLYLYTDQGWQTKKMFYTDYEFYPLADYLPLQTKL